MRFKLKEYVMPRRPERGCTDADVARYKAEKPRPLREQQDGRIIDLPNGTIDKARAAVADEYRNHSAWSLRSTSVGKEGDTVVIIAYLEAKGARR